MGNSATFLVGQHIGDQKPRQQFFSVLDPTLSFPYKPGNTVSVGVFGDSSLQNVS